MTLGVHDLKNMKTYNFNAHLLTSMTFPAMMTPSRRLFQKKKNDTSGLPNTDALASDGGGDPIVRLTLLGDDNNLEAEGGDVIVNVPLTLVDANGDRNGEANAAPFRLVDAACGDVRVVLDAAVDGLGEPNVLSC
jgi:hypothetical protein